MSGQPWPPSLLPVLLPVLLACSQGGEPGPTTRARLDKQAAIAKAAAEESLRLADSRFKAGAGTQLDVLSAQTALTEARSNEIQARYEYNLANANLDRVTGATVRPIQP